MKNHYLLAFLYLERHFVVSFMLAVLMVSQSHFSDTGYFETSYKKECLIQIRVVIFFLTYFIMSISSLVILIVYCTIPLDIHSTTFLASDLILS